MSRHSLLKFVMCWAACLATACSSSPAKKSAGAGGAANVAAVINDLPPAAKSETKSAYKLPPYEEMQLKNGLRVILVPDQGLPYVSYSLLVKTGAVQDPSDRNGLTSMVAELLDKGTKKRSAPQIAAELGQMGADFDASAAMEYTLVTASALSTQAKPLLGNLLEIVTEPTFSEHEIDRMRKQLLATIARRADNPDSFAGLAYDSFLFGEHAYSRSVVGTSKSVGAIKKKHIIQHYLRTFRPNNSILAIVGKYTPELIADVEKGFGTWQAREVPVAQYGQAPPIRGLQVELVDKPGLVQTQIRLGHMGIRRNNEDFIPLRVANTILGGAFASRLTNRIRKELGLTYSINSAFDSRLEPGPFEISTFTKNNSVGQTLTETLKVLSDFAAHGVTGEEVEMAKGYLKGLFPTAIENAEKLAFNLMLLRFYGIPDTYLTSYLNEVDRLAEADVDRVVKKYFDDKNLKVVIYSQASEVLPQIKPIVQAAGGELITKKADEIQ